MSQSSSKPRVFLVANANKPHAPETFERVAKLLEGRGLLVGSDIEGHLERIGETKPDFVVVLGGDGTILGVGQAMQRAQVPIIGVNLGKLGYLADFNEAEMGEHLDRILTDPSLVSARMMLDVRATYPTGETHEGVALNDCVLRVGPPFRTIALSIEVDHQAVTTLVADGLIVSTPTGSTAHNMSCGGPIVKPDVHAIMLTPKCPHSLTHHPVVVGPEAALRITLAPGAEGTAMVLDGRFVCGIPGDTQIMVKRAKESFRLVRNPNRSAWDTLIRRLKWGQRLA